MRIRGYVNGKEGCFERAVTLIKPAVVTYGQSSAPSKKWEGSALALCMTLPC